MTTKILYPSKPSECVCAMSLSEDDAPHPYLSIFYTVTQSTIHFFGLRVMGTETVKTEVEGEEDSERIVYFGAKRNVCSTTNPDEAELLISGELHNGSMNINTSYEGDSIFLADPETATDFIQVIRYIYTAMGEQL